LDLLELLEKKNRKKNVSMRRFLSDKNWFVPISYFPHLADVGLALSLPCQGLKFMICEEGDGREQGGEDSQSDPDQSPPRMRCSGAAGEILRRVLMPSELAQPPGVYFFFRPRSRLLYEVIFSLFSRERSFFLSFFLSVKQGAQVL
jgi:hypothetical protein